MIDVQESQEQKDIADYSAYLQLKKLNYSFVDIANHLSYTEQQLEILLTKFTFDDNKDR